jgi:hypothetical protein
MQRAHVEGLRKADTVTLSVLAQDLIRKPLVKLDPRSLCDLIALADSDKITGSLSRDLRKFKDQMLREITDLSDGVRLGDFLTDMIDSGAARVPASLRVVVLERSESDETPDTVSRRATLLEAFSAAEPDQVTVTDQPSVRVVKAEPKKAPAERATAVRVAGTTAGARSKSVPKAKAKAKVKDMNRVAWIRDDIMERLSHYGSKGIKESLLIAGAIHRSPYKDLSPAEIKSELGALKDLERIALKVGRWSVRGAW